MVFIVASAVVALAVSATSVLGTPLSSTVKHTTHRVRDLEHDIQVRAFQPESVYEVSITHDAGALPTLSDVRRVLDLWGIPIRALLQEKRLLSPSSALAPASIPIISCTRPASLVRLQSISTSVNLS